MDTLLSLLVMTLSEFQTVPERRYAGARRLVAAAVVAALAVAVATGALGCIVAAFWIYLLSVTSPVGAAIGSAVLLLIVGIILALVAKSLFQEEQRASSVKSVVGEALVQELGRGFQRHKGAALLAALIAGVAAGNSKRSK